MDNQVAPALVGTPTSLLTNASRSSSTDDLDVARMGPEGLASSVDSEDGISNQVSRNVIVGDSADKARYFSFIKELGEDKLSFIIDAKSSYYLVKEQIQSMNSSVVEKINTIEINNRHIKDEEITLILQAFKNLNKITVIDSPHFTGKFVNWALFGLNIKEVDFTNTSFSNEGLIRMSQYCHGITSLCLDNCKLDALYVTMSFPGLEVLSVRGIKLPERYLLLLPNCCRSIISLDVSFTVRSDDCSVDWDFKNLKKLKANSTSVNNHELRLILANNSDLKELHLDDCGHIDLDAFFVINSNAFNDIKVLSLRQIKKASKGTVQDLLRASDFQSVDITAL